MKNAATLAQFALVSGFALIGTAMPSPVAAEGNLNALLHGSYAFATTRTCTVSSRPFAEPNLGIPSGATVFRQYATDHGILSFNGDGTATATGRTRTINVDVPADSFPFIPYSGSPLNPTFVSVSDFESEVAYTVNPDGTVDTQSNSSFTVLFPVPAATSTAGTATGNVGRLQIAGGNTMLISAPLGDPSVPSVETLTYSFPVGLVQHRVCARSTTAAKLPGK